MFPSLHENVRNAVSEKMQPIWFNETNSQDGCNNCKDTSVMGKFECKNNRCRKMGWSSKQRCKSCDELGVFTLDEQSYVDRVSYRIQKWAGIGVEKPYYAGTSKGPHEGEFCEGCKNGHCTQSSQGR
ncbi:hypothetical protein QBC44DRAFT_350994 [Cladorrhinum sp. PSN332]|nr:hypothetical protein QBC44DRAFT_350994 [Cladorrhinum sp. PSN332]